MKISTRDKKILLMFLGVLLLVLSYFFIYRQQIEQAASIEQENIILKERLNKLLELAENKEFYEQEIKTMNEKIEEYCQNFPAAIKEEDGILLANNMEKKLDMKISNVGLGMEEVVYAMDGETTSRQDNGQDATLMEQGAEATQQQIAEIEGIEGEDAAVPEQGPIDGTAEAISDFLYNIEWNPTLYRNQDTLQFVTTYKGLKNAVKYLNTQTGRITIDNINASFDSSSGNLAGTMVINLFSMDNAGITYVEPDAGKVKLGTQNIFGTIETPVKKTAKKQKSK